MTTNQVGPRCGNSRPRGDRHSSHQAGCTGKVISPGGPLDRGGMKMAEADYIEAIAGREAENPERRAELADQVMDARIALEDTANEWGQALICDLEGHDEEHEGRKADSLEAYEAARSEFDKAAGAAAEFLRGDDGLSQKEREAREAVATLALHHAGQLPSRSEWREQLITIALIGHEFAVEAYEERVAELELEVRAGEKTAT